MHVRQLRVHDSFEQRNNRWLTGLHGGRNGRSLDVLLSGLRNNHAKVLYPFTADVLRFADQIYQTQLNNDTCVITSVT